LRQNKTDSSSLTEQKILKATKSRKLQVEHMVLWNNFLKLKGNKKTWQQSVEQNKRLLMG